MKAIIIAATAAILTLTAATASAEVFVNGVQVDRVEAAVQIEGCQVRFDAEGNVHITTPRNVLIVDSAAASSPADEASTGPLTAQR